MNLWPITIAARRSLLETFESLDADEWQVPSLCDAWSVREVLAHLILAARPPLPRYARTALKERCGFDRANHLLAVADAKRPADELIAGYRAVVENRFSLRAGPPPPRSATSSFTRWM